jgi:hypothetical protein
MKTNHLQFFQTILFSIALVAVAGCSKEVKTSAEGSSGSSHGRQNKTICQSGGGKWTEFADSCGDSCDAVKRRMSMQCSEKTTLACNCGLDWCWDGKVCRRN